MNVLSVNVLRGPNYWSNYRKKLIVIKIDLGKYEFLPSNKLPNFIERLKQLLPSLYAHHCSPGVPGGFYSRLEEGTWLGHIIEHVALEMQSLAGMDCGFGRTYGADKEGMYHIIFSYLSEKAGLYVAEAAVNLVRTLAENKPYDDLDQDIKALKTIWQKEKLGPSTQALVDEAKLRKIPVFLNESSSLIYLGYGIKQKRLWASISSHTQSIGTDIAADKELTKKILAEHFIPVPEGAIVSSLEALYEAREAFGFPLAIKPLNGNHGRGVTTNILDESKLLMGYHLAQRISKNIIVERFIEGDDYRFLVVDYKVVAVAKRIPAHVIGTGLHTIQELIDQVNQDPRRGQSHENILTEIKVESITQSILREHNLSLDDILPENQRFVLKDTANISCGGTAIDVTALVHRKTILLAERVARLIGLDICGIDIMAKNISDPLDKTNGAVLEVNASPGLRMHLAPSEGMPRNVAKPIIDMLFPKKDKGTIPIIAVTGTNGKTTVVRLIASMLKKAGHYVGFTTTDGIYLNNDSIYQGDCSGPKSAQSVLRDPKVDYAVLECARGGILRSGLGFDECDISIVTNITSDHLGLNEINTLEDLAEVKAVVARSTKKEGYSLLNAENDYTYQLKDELNCHVALFSRVKNDRITHHCAEGGVALYIHHNKLTLQHGKNFNAFLHINDIPLTFNGSMSVMIQNILPVVLAGYLSGFSIEFIKDFLIGFQPTASTLPGRMNVFDFPNVRVLLDYAHNEEAYIELGSFLETTSYDKKIGIIGIAGDRRDEDIIKVGSLAALLFDEIVIRHDADGRGRTDAEITDFLYTGIRKTKPDIKVTVISDEFEALEFALKQAQKNTLIFYAVEAVFAAIEHVKKLQSLLTKVKEHYEN